VHDTESTTKIMWTVSGALLPATLMSVYYFGMPAILVILVCLVSSLLAEAAVQWMLKKPVTISDGSAFLTGLLLAMNLPANIPLHIPVVGSFVAIVITKHLFGGLGFNIFNPALIGRAFVLISFPKLMTTYVEPTMRVMAMDAKTTATPLVLLKEEGMAKLLEVFHTQGELYRDLFLGNRAGSLGETSVIALLLGAAFLLMKRYITWHVPLPFIATSASFLAVRRKGRAHVGRRNLPYDVRRPYPRRILHGNGLRDRPVGPQRAGRVRRCLRGVDRAHPAQRRVS
jgi:electron transport complex protein RnfD